MIAISPAAAPTSVISPAHSPPPLSPSYSPSTSTTFTQSPPSKLPVDFSPPLIAMVVVIAAAFLVVTYSRHLLPPIRRFSKWYQSRRRRRRRRNYLPSSVADLDSPPHPGSPFGLSGDSAAFHVFTSGLDDSVIKTIPLSLYTAKFQNQSRHQGYIDDDIRDCAVCLIEFEDNDYVRTLPVCSHAFHVDCIDAWLRSHANCPLCRAGIIRPESPFIPIMAARIRPSLDFITLEPLTEITDDSQIRNQVTTTVSEITEEPSPIRNSFTRRDFLLKRSYSFGFERSLASERMVMEPVTASPWRYRRAGSFWSKRPSPFGSSAKNRVFSFRHYKGIKSPFFRRRGFFPLSESSVRFSGGSGSSRRSKSMTSPMFMRSAAAATAAFSSSRLRCGDPEALLSPERFNRR